MHLDSPGTDARVLVVGSAFNTTVPELLLVRLSQLSVSDPICRWIMDFLINKKETADVAWKTHIRPPDPQYQSTTRLCVLTPSVSTPMTVSLRNQMTDAGDTTVMGLIANGEAAYRKEVELLVSECSTNHLLLNTQKTVEMVDFRHDPPHHQRPCGFQCGVTQVPVQHENRVA